MNIIDVPFNEGMLELPPDQKEDRLLMIFGDYCFRVPLNMFYFIWDQLLIRDDTTRSQHSHAAVAELERTKLMFDSTIGIEHPFPNCQDVAWHLITILANHFVTIYRLGEDEDCPLQALGEYTYIYEKTHSILLQPVKALHLKQLALN